MWFFEPGCAVRDLATMINVYHQTVGRNGVLELDFAINRDGLVDDLHVERYSQFGDWIRACYGTPVGETRSGAGGSPLNRTALTITLAKPTLIDRTALREDQSQGQRVRAYTIQAQVGGAWVPFAQGPCYSHASLVVYMRLLWFTCVSCAIHTRLLWWRGG